MEKYNFTYSFIIPHKDSPELLTRCISSIPQRDDVQIIVVDDNSEDHRRPDIKRSDIQIIYLSEEESNGAGHARNVGLEKAKGKWLLFADCDDYYQNGFLSLLDNYIDTDIDILYFSSYLIEKDSQFINKENRIDKILRDYLLSEKTSYDNHKLGLSLNMPWNKMFNHRFINKIGVKFEEIPISNDAWFCNYAGVCSQKIEVIQDKLYFYILNDQGITRKKRPLSHYIKAIRSNTRRNKLKLKYNCIDLVTIPGFNEVNILRDFGRCTYWGLIIFKIFTDYTFVLKSLKLLFVKMQIINNK